MSILDTIEYIHVVSPHDAPHVGLRPSHWFQRADRDHVAITDGAIEASAGTLFMDTVDGEHVLRP
jgi:hypothetical protein